MQHHLLANFGVGEPGKKPGTAPRGVETRLAETERPLQYRLRYAKRIYYRFPNCAKHF